MNYAILFLLFNSLSLLPIELSAQANFTPNYDEDLVPAYSLPSPLVLENDEKVKTQSDWQQRRIEILQLFATQVYGKTPNQTIEVRTKTLSTDQGALAGKATRQEVRIFFTEEDIRPYMDIILFIPNNARSGRTRVSGIEFLR